MIMSNLVVFTHCKDTFTVGKHHIKVNFASDDPFNNNNTVLHIRKVRKSYVCTVSNDRI